ncbi:gag-proteinase polyprotein [Cucumis melo var. makuwa]|uniref:Gag-proteinase polyprotein n=1 Tax=Cucumis melo var. makuwa TaxID=1194695 RepID=A0A5A7V8V3_CUCMM|nr:gag-proteinase polyprotein [Cucumis melo var. makuwa]
MDEIREGNSTSRPLLLDGGNYGHWKSRMEAFLMSLDMRSNSRALNALFNAVDPNIFKLINTCKSAKDAWDILEVAFEGTSKVKISMLQILTSRFEALQMTENETIVEFNVRVLDIANESDVLGEKMSDSKLGRKVLRSLPSKFNMKKETWAALTSGKEEPTEENKVPKNNDVLAESVVLLIKQKEHEREKGNGFSRPEKYGKGIRCHECEGFGHIQSECATYLKRKKKILVATFLDEEDYSESDDEEFGMALISISTMNDEEAAKVNTQASDQLEPMINKCLTDGLMEKKWKEDQKIILQQQERIQCLVEENQSFLSSIVTLKDELKETKNQLEELFKSVKMLTNGTLKLDDLLGQGRRVDDKRGLASVNYVIKDIKSASVRIDSQNKVFLSGTRLSDNCYHWDAEAFPLSHLPHWKAAQSVLLESKSNKSVSLPSTSHTLELLHIDLMGPMQAESLGGRRVILRPGTTTTSYELWKGRKPNVKHNKMSIPTASTSVNLFETCGSGASVTTCQEALERTANSPDSPKQKIMSPTHIAKNHPSSSIIGDVHSGITTRKKERRNYAKMGSCAKITLCKYNWNQMDLEEQNR